MFLGNVFEPQSVRKSEYIKICVLIQEIFFGKILRDLLIILSKFSLKLVYLGMGVGGIL